MPFGLLWLLKRKGGVTLNIEISFAIVNVCVYVE